MQSGCMEKSIEDVSENSSRCSISSQQGIGDNTKISEILSNEDGRARDVIGRRLSHLNSIPLVPRVNGAIPSEDDATIDYQRLVDRLQAYCLVELKVAGDGNCQFRALSDQLYNTPDYHKHVRKEVVKQLKKFQSEYIHYVPMKYKDYYRMMRKSGVWGDHVTLQAASDRFAAKICLLTSFRDTCYIEIMPRQQTPQREIWLSFWSEVHYNSLYEAGEVPCREEKKKKHWLF